MRDQIPDADALPAGLPEEKKNTTYRLPLAKGHPEVVIHNESLSELTKVNVRPW